MTTKGIAALMLMWCGFVLPAEQARGQSVSYVDDTATGVGDGSGWCDAYIHLQDALAAASVPGSTITEIRVAGGPYRPDQGAGQVPGDRQTTFQLHSGIALRGGYAGCGTENPDQRDIGAYETVLSGDLAQDDGPDFLNYDENAYTVVTGSGTDATAVLEGFTIRGGHANGGPRANAGAGMYNREGSPTVSNCTFVRNVAAKYGGGMSNVFDGSPTITNCRFIGNFSFFWGGAMHVNRGSPKLINCMFSGNSAYEGGAVAAFRADPELTNCTIAGNVAYLGGGISAQIGGDDCAAPIVRNSILWENSASSGSEVSAQVYADPSTACPGVTPTIEYTCIQGGWSGIGGTGNIIDPPEFVDADGPDNAVGTLDDNVRLAAFSPCLDAGDNNAIPPDQSDLDEDGDTTEPVPYDLDGDQRVLNGVVDMGVHEGPNQALVLSAESVVVPEEGSATFTVALLIDPLGPVDITVQHHSGDSDISVVSGGALAFHSGNFDVPQTVVLAASADDDFEPGTALFQVAGPGLYASGVTAREGDNDPLPDALLVDARSPPGGNGLTWDTAFDDLQHALAYMKQLDGTIGEVWVVGGAYSPTKPFLGPFATFQLLNGTALYGGFAGYETERDQREPDANVTILSGDTAGDDDLPLSNSSCCVAHPEPGCDNMDCEAAVCAVDPSCCETEWATYCALITSGRCLCGDLCGHDCDNSYHVVTGSGTDTTTVLDGFTITAGNAVGVRPFEKGGGMYNAPGDPTVNDCTFKSNTGIEGGGMANIASSPTLTDCTFLHNDAPYGGAMYNKNSSPTVTDCQFIENQAWSGGAIRNLGSGAVLRRCTFIRNTATTAEGGAIVDESSTTVIEGSRFTENLASTRGGACAIFYSTTQISNCLFESNTAGYYGGALNVNGGTLLMPRCLFISNGSGFDEKFGRGGAVSLAYGAALTQINCAFYENYAHIGGAFHMAVGCVADMVNSVFSGNFAKRPGDAGGAIYVWARSTLTLTNCTMVHNIAFWGGGIFGLLDNSLTLTNCILWGNDTDQIDFSGDLFTTNYNCIEGFGPPLVGVGNIASDPRFVDPDGPDNIFGTEDDALRLNPGSPCIDAGDNTVVPVDVGDLDDDGDVDEPIPFDVQGYSRFFDDPGTPDSGNGLPPIVDMGAYEYHQDCNDNGVLDSIDIAEGTSYDCTGDGVPDECEPDCNDNTAADSCDIAGPTSDDCNGNAMPDECEIDRNSNAPGGPFYCIADCDPDCNGNATPDDCEPDSDADDVIDACDNCQAHPNPEQLDCDWDGAGDVCEIAEGSSQDCNADLVPDDCVAPVDPPYHEPPEVRTAKNRYWAIVPNNPGRETAIRVRFASLPPPFHVWDGLKLFAGAPQQICENAGQGSDISPPNCGPAPGLEQKWFWVARLECDPANAHFMDWTTLANYCDDGSPCNDHSDCPQGACGLDPLIIHLYHEGVVPSRMASSTGPIDFPSWYDAQFVDDQCDLADESSYSLPLSAAQAAWGDVVLNVAGCPNGLPDGRVDVITDVVAILNKFANLHCAPKKARVDLVPCRVDFNISIPDVVAALDAFAGRGYEDTCGSGQCGPLGLCKGGPDHNQACTSDDDCSSDPCTAGQ